MIKMLNFVGLQIYNAAIKLAHDVEYEGSVDLLTKLLTIEVGNIDWVGLQRSQIKQMGLDIFLANQSEVATN